MIQELPATIHQSELADIAGVTERWLRQQSTDGILPKCDRCRFPTRDSLIALRRYWAEKETPASERKIRAEASILERKDKREAGDTLDIEVVKKSWENVTLIFRQRILRIGNNSQSKAGLNDSQRKSIDLECADALRELEKKLIYMAELEEVEDEKP